MQRAIGLLSLFASIAAAGFARGYFEMVGRGRSNWWILIATVLPALVPSIAAAQVQDPAKTEIFSAPPLLRSGDRITAEPEASFAPDVLPMKSELLRPERELNTWWHEMLQRPFGPPEAAINMELERALVQALSRSARVRVLRETAAINATAIPQAQANFDPVSFAETRFTNTSDPVGSTLTTGGPSRFLDKTWYASGGIRKQTLTGAQLELAQRLGYENSNSVFFVPPDQATAKLTLNVTQPLLRGAGYAYNSGVIVLATLDAQIAHAQYCSDLQKYVLEFHSAFWDIYLQRAVLLQRRRLLQEAVEVLRELELRRDVDVQGSQLSRVRAAVASREASLLRYEATVKNAVARFRALVNDPFLDDPKIAELIPLDSPDAGYGETDLAMSLSTSLQHRAEIDQAMQQLQAASQRLNLAKKDVLPMVNLVLGSYVNGLQGQNDFSQAYADQFSVGRPTYWAGIVYERPFGNRGPQALQQQRILELSRASSQLQAVTATVRAEVEVAVREVATTHGEMLSRHQAMLAEQDQVNFLLQRWRLLAADQQVAGVVFNNLLDAQDRRAAAEFDFVTAQVAHRVAWINLRRVTGTLCDCSAVAAEDISPVASPATPALSLQPPKPVPQSTSEPTPVEILPISPPVLPEPATIVPLPPINQNG